VAPGVRTGVDTVPAPLSARSPRWQLFRPILAGATARDRALACLGVLVAIALVSLVGALVHGGDDELLWIVGPMGASAVLLFALPTSPMAQPWPIVGGNVLSAAAGLAVGEVVGDRALAAGLGVALAIALMSVTRSLHPPGGAAALTAALGGPGVASAAFFPLVPVGLNAVILVATGWVFHRLAGHAYPHVAPAVPATVPPTTDPAPSQRVGFRAEDVDAVLARIGDAFDISRADLGVILREVELQALARAHADLTCGAIMSRDVISVTPESDPETARRLLLESGVRLLPVLDAQRRVVGAIGLRELAAAGERVEDVMVPALTTTPDAPASALLGPLADQGRHAATVVGADGRVVGLVTQTDLLAAIGRELFAADAQSPDGG
jgi:CBS domain-containing membrane protein